LFVALYAIISALFTSTTVFFSKLFFWTCQNQKHLAYFSLFGIFWSDFSIFLQVVWHFLFTWTWQPCSKQWCHS